MILREEGPYFTCQRCQHKVPISSMVWDYGKLVCSGTMPGTYCSSDKKVLGSVELRQAREVTLDRGERQPEPKLINPTDPSLQLEIIPASSGTY